jgi:hypothetical protein
MGCRLVAGDRSTTTVRTPPGSEGPMSQHELLKIQGKMGSEAIGHGE